MSHKIAVEMRDGRLIGADAWAAEQIAALPRGVVYNAVVTVARRTADDEHAGTLRFYMAGINLLYDSVDTGPGTPFPTPRHLRKHILRDLGFYVAIPQRDGAMRKDVDSMALDKMEFEDLKLCLELSRAYCVATWGFDPWEEWKRQHPLPATS